MISDLTERLASFHVGLGARRDGPTTGLALLRASPQPSLDGPRARAVLVEAIRAAHADGISVGGFATTVDGQATLSGQPARSVSRALWRHPGDGPQAA